MAEYKSRYSGLAFRVGGERRKFAAGRYVTDNKDEIAVLDKLADVVRVDKDDDAKSKEKKAEVTTAEAIESKPANKKPKAKASAK